MEQSHRRSAEKKLATTIAASLVILATGGAGMSAPAGAAASHPVTRSPTSLSHVNKVVPPRNVKLVRTRASLLGTHKWYRQVSHGHVVVGGWFGTHYNKFTKRVTVWDGRKHVGRIAVTAPAIGLQRASAVAAQQAKTSPSRIVKAGLWILPPSLQRAHARLVYAISSADGRGARTSYVDAANGKVLKTQRVADKARNDRTPVTGRARVFDPNPVVKLQNEQLRDHRNAANAVPATGYTFVRLFGLDRSHTLSGRYAKIVNKFVAHSATNTYLFNRANSKFEQTNAYYAVNKEQAFLHRLGFLHVNSSAQRVRTDAFPDDNSYYDTATDEISLGRGGVDDAEDPEVVWHEYGHAMQADQVLDFGWKPQGAAMGEGFGDYMAVAMSQGASPTGTSKTPTACVMDWDATSYTIATPHCIRRTDTAKVYPHDLNADPHAGGEIWSGALWDMNQSLGRDNATRIIVESNFWMYPTIKMVPGARIMLTVTHQLAMHGFIPQGSLGKVRTALAKRHLLG